MLALPTHCLPPCCARLWGGCAGCAAGAGRGDAGAALKLPLRSMATMGVMGAAGAGAPAISLERRWGGMRVSTAGAGGRGVPIADS